MSRSPAVSVVIPAFERPERLRRAATSVLAQRFRDLELIVVDDGSEHGLNEGLTGLDERIRYHWQPNRGASAARNVGIGMARAPLVAFLDADNRWLPDHLDVVLAILERFPEAVLGSTCPEFRLEGCEQPDEARLIDALPEALLGNAFGYVSCIAVRREALLTVGGFDERMAAGEDDDLWLRLAIEGPFVMLRRRTIVRRHTRGGARDCGRRTGAYTEANTLSLTRVIGELERSPAPERAELIDRARAILHVLAAVGAIARHDLTAASADLATACALLPELERNPGLILAHLWKSAQDRNELRRRVDAAAASMPDPACHTALYFRGYAAVLALTRGRLWTVVRLVLRRPHLLRRSFVACAYRPSVRLAGDRLREIAYSRRAPSGPRPLRRRR